MFSVTFVLIVFQKFSVLVSAIRFSSEETLIAQVFNFMTCGWGAS